MKRWMILWSLLVVTGCTDKGSTEPDGDDTGTTPGETTTPSTDCDEEQLFYEDLDGDGYGSAVTAEACEAPEGFVAASGDCDDDSAGVHPGAAEVCDESGTDEDCDGLVNGADDSITGAQTFYADTDGDGLGDPEQPWESCYEVDGYVSNANDCDDSSADVGPLDPLLGCYQCDAVVPTDHASIQAAINSASSGELICVEPGTYFENVSFSGRNVWLFGMEGPDVTVINGSGAAAVVRMESITGSSTGLQGFTITNGASVTGAGVYITDSDPILADLIVSDNRCGTDAGAACEGIGIYAESSSLYLYGVDVSDNLGYYDGTVGFDQSKGAGIFLSNSTMSADGIRVADNAIEPHSVMTSWGVTVWGTGLYASNTTANINNGRFTGNSAKGIFNEWEETYLIGSAIFASEGSDLTLNHVVLAGNKVDSQTYFTCSGPLAALESTISMTNGIVAHNVSKCGDVNGGIAYGYQADLILDHVNFVANKNDSSSGAGGLYLYQGTLSLTNSTFQDNTGEGSVLYGAPSTYSIRNCNFADSASDSFSSTPSPVGLHGNIHAASGFLDYGTGGWADWDQHLTTTSSLIDGGSGSDPDGSTADIGAFGGAGASGWDLDWDGSPAWWHPGSYDSSDAKAGLDCADMDPAVSADSGC